MRSSLYSKDWKHPPFLSEEETAKHLNEGDILLRYTPSPLRLTEYASRTQTRLFHFSPRALDRLITLFTTLLSTIAMDSLLTARYCIIARQLTERRLGQDPERRFRLTTSEETR